MTIQVLLIEDDQADAFLLQELLAESAADKKKGSLAADVHCVDRLDDGIRQAAKGGFDIIISDLGLPDSQGLATVKRLASALRFVPIVVMTGLDDQRLGFEAVNAGAQDYLVKGQVSGDMLVRCIRYAIERKRIENENLKIIAELQEALTKVKLLTGMLPICCSCKKIRDDKGYWQQIESYIKEHSQADFSHGICPECCQKLYPEFYKGKA